MMEKLIFEKSSVGRRGYRLPRPEISGEEKDFIPARFLREESAQLPEVSELDVVRHFTRLAQVNFSIDGGFYPLGSCTMKYNPRVAEKIVALGGFVNLHPCLEEGQTQGILKMLWQFERWLCEICGMAEFTLQPAAGAQGEITGVLIARAFYTRQGNPRKKIIIPDSAHGTNPGSATIGGYEVREVESTAEGCIAVHKLEELVDEDTALVMITNPNTLGLFEKDILKISEIVHRKGALMYLDGANLNALLGIVRPGDLGFDLLQINLHKTFATPHGGGGPGSGPLGVKKELVPFLPVPRCRRKGEKYFWNSNFPHSIGKLHSFYGNMGVIIKAFVYLLGLGEEGLRAVSENAIINANYLKTKLEKYYEVPFKQNCMHEFVLSVKKQKEKYGVRAVDVAKRLLDFGFHPPTIYFPLIVQEALMIEPTETESKQTLDEFVEALIRIAGEAESQPQVVKNAPWNTPVRRVDEVAAVRQPDLCFGTTEKH